jgi:RNA polymerase sigma factor (sigma-70 family)
VTDQELFDGIARKDNRAFSVLYQQQRGKILAMVQRNNGTPDDALDVFQEGVIVLWTNITQGKFQLTDKARLSTYLYALCRNQWISRLRKKKELYSLDDEETREVADEVEALEAAHERIDFLHQKLQELSEACRLLLRLFYYRKASMQEIADELDLTEATAKNNKYRCMQRLRALCQT